MGRYALDDKALRETDMARVRGVEAFEPVLDAETAN